MLSLIHLASEETLFTFVMAQIHLFLHNVLNLVLRLQFSINPQTKGKNIKNNGGRKQKHTTYVHKI